MDDIKTPTTEPTVVPVNTTGPTPPKPAPAEDTPESLGMTTPHAISTEPAEPVPAMDTPTDPEPVTHPQTTPQIAEHASGGKNHMAVIVVALVVMIALIGAIVYVYKQQNSTAVKKTDSKTSQSSNSAPTPVSAGDVSDTTKAIDDSLNSIDADKDFSSNDLSDATLGL